MRTIPVPLTEKPSPQVKVYLPVATSIVKELPLPPKSTTVRDCPAAVTGSPAKVTVKPQTKSSPPQPPGAVQLTAVVPRGKTDPEAGVHTACVPAVVRGVGYVTAAGAPVGMQMSTGNERVAELQPHEKAIPSY